MERCCPLAAERALCHRQTRKAAMASTSAVSEKRTRRLRKRSRVAGSWLWEVDGCSTEGMDVEDVGTAEADGKLVAAAGIGIAGLSGVGVGVCGVRDEPDGA